MRQHRDDARDDRGLPFTGEESLDADEKGEHGKGRFQEDEIQLEEEVSQREEGERVPDESRCPIGIAFPERERESFHQARDDGTDRSENKKRRQAVRERRIAEENVQERGRHEREGGVAVVKITARRQRFDLLQIKISVCARRILERAQTDKNKQSETEKKGRCFSETAG